MAKPARIGVACFGALDSPLADALGGMPGVELAAACHPEEGARAELSRRLGIGQAFPSLEEMIETGNLDAIFLAFPHRRRAAALCLALDAGLHVLCQGLPASQASEAANIVATAGMVGKTAMYVCPESFAASAQAARDIALSGRLGSLFHVTARAVYPLAYRPEEGQSGPLEDGEALGSSLLFGPAADAIELAWRAMDCPSAVEACAGVHGEALNDPILTRENAPKRAAFGMLRFKNGSTLAFSAFPCASAGDLPSGTVSLELIGDKGSLELAGDGRIRLFGEPLDIKAQPRRSARDSPWARAAAAFTDAIRDGTEPPGSEKQGLSLMQMLDALRQSAREKRAVSIEAKRDLDDLFNQL